MMDVPAHSVRPPITRGQSAPIYQRRHHAQPPDEQAQMRLAPLLPIDEASARALNGLPTADTIRRTLSPAEYTSLASARPAPSPVSATTASGGLFTPPQTPSSGGNITPRIMTSDDPSLPQQTYFMMDTYRPPSHSARTQPQLPQSSPQTSWTPMPPSVTSNVKAPTQLLRHGPQSEIKMEIETSRTSHTLLAPLGDKFSSDCITIAAKKHNVLQIMADRWDQEKDCHFEWLITLDRDADMSSVTANFTEGLLKVTVRRRLQPELLSGSNNTLLIVAKHS